MKDRTAVRAPEMPPMPRRPGTSFYRSPAAPMPRTYRIAPAHPPDARAAQPLRGSLLRQKRGTAVPLFLLKPCDRRVVCCGGAAYYSYSTTLAQEVRNSRSSGLRFTSWDAATMGIHFSTYWRAVSLFLQNSRRYCSASSFNPLRQ